MKSIFLVDVDDTVLDFHGVSAKALRVAFEEHGVPFCEDLQSSFPSFNTSLWEALERKELTREELMRERFVWFFEKTGVKGIDGYAVNRTFISYISNCPEYMPGAEAFLQELGRLGRIFFVTNGTESIQKSRFDIANLWEKGTDTFISQKVGFDKPAKEYTDYVIAHIPDFDSAQAVWIGDSLSADIKAANEANVTSIWFNPHKKELVGGVKPDYIAQNFDGVLGIIRKINGK